MKRWYIALAWLLLIGWPWFPGGAHSAAEAAAPSQIERWFQTEAADFAAGTLEGTVVAKAADGEIRLAEGQQRGTYTSVVHEMAILCRGLGVLYHSRVPAGASLDLELRLQSEEGGWNPWTWVKGGPWVDPTGAAAGDYLLVFAQPGRRVQYRLTLAGEKESPLLEDIGLVCLAVEDDPSPRAVPPWEEPNGRPHPVDPARWGSEAGSSLAVTPTTATLQVQVRPATVAIGGDFPAGPALRMLQRFHREVLGGEDLPYFYLVDGQGCIYQGGAQAIGPVAYIGLLGSDPREVATPTAEDGLVALLDWWGQAVGDLALESPGDALLAERVGARLRAGDLRRSAWFLARGQTGREMDAWILLANPGSKRLQVTAELVRSRGRLLRRTLLLPAQARAGLLVDRWLAEDMFWAKLRADGDMVVERAIYYGHDGDDSAGLDHLSRLWYLPGGMQTVGFTTTYILLNPGTGAVTATVTLFGQSGAVAETQVVLGAGKRVDLAAAEVYSQAVPLGAQVSAGGPVAVEQEVRFDDGQGGYGLPGTPQLSRRWTFAGVETAEPFVTELALLNPYTSSVAVTLTLMSEDGTTLRRAYTIPPGAQVLSLNTILPRLALAADLQAGQPIAAARVSFFNGFRAAHATLGAVRPARQWLLAEGATAVPFETFLLVANPNPVATSLDISFWGSRGEVGHLNLVMPAQARLTLPVGQYFPDVPAIAARVLAEWPVVVERSMYLHDRQGGHAALGTAR